MKIGKHHVPMMYLVTLVLLAALSVYGAYVNRTFPVSLIVAVLACAIIDLAIGAYHKKSVRIPLSAMITGLIIGSVAPITAPLMLVVLASVVAELSKFFIKAKGRNILNPAVVGLLVALVVFGAGDEWWAAAGVQAYGILIPLAAVLIIAAYEGRRWVAGLSAAAVLWTGGLLLGGAGFSLAAAQAALLSVSYYFAFLMVADPKTSPNGYSGQILYGAAAAGLSLLLIAVRAPYPILMALLAMNLAYAAVRIFYRPAPLAANSNAVNIDAG